MGPYGFGGGMGWGGWVAMAVSMVVFWGLAATAVVFAVHWLGHRHDSIPDPDGPLSALRLLDERLARGDIDPDDYSRRRQLLTAR